VGVILSKELVLINPADNVQVDETTAARVPNPLPALCLVSNTP
jgi:hypothetical protein